jgi:hypothetical protein
LRKSVEKQDGGFALPYRYGRLMPADQVIRAGRHLFGDAKGVKYYLIAQHVRIYSLLGFNNSFDNFIH